VTAHFSRLDDEIGQKTNFITTLLMVVTTFLMGPHLRRDRSRGPHPLVHPQNSTRHFTRRRKYMIGFLFATATYYTLYLRLASVKDVTIVSLGVFVLILATVFTSNMLGTTLAELFPTRVRYTAMSKAFNLGIGFFGGFTPLIIR
jgi:hypothetical protein